MTASSALPAPIGDVRLFTDDDFQFTALLAIGKAAQGTMDIGVVLATLARIIDGDPASWLAEWTATADRLRRRAISSRASGALDTACHYFLAASEAYARALSFIDGMPDDGELLPLFRLHRACWDDFIAVSGGRHVAVRVPYEGDALPGFLFRPDARGAARPTLVITNGSDGSLSGLWAEGIAAGLERGYNVFVFDGPGQQSMLFERDVPFRHDWEAVLTPVVDAIIGRDDVDESSLLAYGVSQGGYWLARGLAFEHRFAAAAVDGGVVDVGRSWCSSLPPALLAAFQAGDVETFNEAMSAGFADPVRAREFAFRARPYGNLPAPFDLFTAVGRYALDDDFIRAITTPTLVLDPEDEAFFPGQPREFFDALTAPKSLARFTREDGASQHCQPLARTQAAMRICDFYDQWLAVGGIGDA